MKSMSWEGDAPAEPRGIEDFPDTPARREPRPPGFETSSIDLSDAAMGRMAIPQKHSRKITVAGNVYRWCLGKRDRLTSTPGMNDRIIVEAADCQGSRLVVHLHPLWDVGTSVTPKHVADFIQDAIGSGWRPLEAGPQFVIRDGTPHEWT